MKEDRGWFEFSRSLRPLFGPSLLPGPPKSQLNVRFEFKSKDLDVKVKVRKGTKVSTDDESALTLPPRSQSLEFVDLVSILRSPVKSYGQG